MLTRLAMSLTLTAMLAGCTTGSTPDLASLRREVNVTPTRGLLEEQVSTDDRECAAWARATKAAASCALRSRIFPTSFSRANDAQRQSYRKHTSTTMGSSRITLADGRFHLVRVGRNIESERGGL
jgi:hypothetical protein